MLSFEGLTSETFANENVFCVRFSGLLYDTVEFGEVRGITDEETLARICETLDCGIMDMIELVSQKG